MHVARNVISSFTGIPEMVIVIGSSSSVSVWLTVIVGVANRLAVNRQIARTHAENGITTFLFAYRLVDKVLLRRYLQPNQLHKGFVTKGKMT